MGLKGIINVEGNLLSHYVLHDEKLFVKSDEHGLRQILPPVLRRKALR